MWYSIVTLEKEMNFYYVDSFFKIKTTFSSLTQEKFV